MSETGAGCPHAGCPGRIGPHGFCRRCGRSPIAPPPAPEPDPVPDRTRASGFPTDDRELYTLPPVVLPGPIDVVDTAPRMPLDERICDCCHQLVGQPDAYRPDGLDAGFCERCGTPFSFAVTLSEGAVVEGRYRVLGSIGHGGQGWVYLADDLRLPPQQVALKGLTNTASAAAAQAAAREAERLTELEHPNLVRVITVAEHPDPGAPGRPHRFIVLAYVPGRSLDEIVDAARAGQLYLPLSQVCRYGMSLLSALGYLHDRGWLYCDLKPDNVIHHERTIKMIDMGALREHEGPQGPFIGAPAYVVDQQEIDDHGATVRSDLYALGKTMSELYGAARRYALNPLTELVERSLIDVIKRATAPFDDRFEHVAQMHDQLGGVLRFLLSAEDGRERPARSAIFEESAAVLRSSLGEVPALDSLCGTDPRDLPDSGIVAPPTAAAASALPAPRADPDDPAAAELDAMTDTDPQRVPAKLALLGARTRESRLAHIRADIRLGRLQPAATALAALLDELDGDGPDWRLRWHQALLDLARGDVDTAGAGFAAVAAHWPGEAVPHLALAICDEIRGRTAVARARYRMIGRRDPHMASAAFGLARTLLADGDRAGAVEALASVPATSRHHDAARIALVRLRTAILPGPAGRPPAADVATAVLEIPALDLDPASRERLVLPIVALAHRDHDHWPACRPLVGDLDEPRTAPSPWRLAWLGTAAVANGRDELRTAEILGRPADEGAALLLSRCYRRLADQATHPGQRSTLIDLAHRVRPATLT